MLRYLPSAKRRRSCLTVPLLVTLLLFTSTMPGAAMAQMPDSLDIKIGQMLMTGFRGTTVRNESAIARDIKDLHLGGVVLFDFDVQKKEYGRNITSPMQLMELTSSLQDLSPIPLFIAVDQEGGMVSRLKSSTGFPLNVSHAYLGNLNNGDSTAYYSDIAARSLAIVGINVNFSPVVDLNVNPSNPVIGKLGRSISADPEIVTRHAGIMIDAYHVWNLVSAIKHFPGHGSSVDDSHLGFVDVSESWSELELQPFEVLVRKKMPDMVMTGHLFNKELDPEWPATLSKSTIQGLLRDSMGFEGVVISDDMMMRALTDNYGLETAITQAVNAGIDILLFANNGYQFDPEIGRKAFTTLKNLVQNGAIPAARIDESYARIMTAKRRIKGSTAAK